MLQISVLIINNMAMLLIIWLLTIMIVNIIMMVIFITIVFMIRITIKQAIEKHCETKTRNKTHPMEMKLSFI